MARKRTRRESKAVDFDLTPMIDVTFQLLIFFIIAMKFKQPERRQGANLSLNSGPSPTLAEKTKQITVRLNWDAAGGAMTYQVCRGDAKTSDFGPIEGGTLAQLLNDRFVDGNPRYRGVYDQLVDHLRQTHILEPDAVKMEIALTNETSKSAALQIDDLPPWGFVTLALDACTRYNMMAIKEWPERLPEKYRKTGLEIVTKNSTPSELLDRSGGR